MYVPSSSNLSTKIIPDVKKKRLLIFEIFNIKSTHFFSEPCIDLFQGHKNFGLCGKGMNRTSVLYFTEQFITKFFPNKPWFLRVCSTSLLKTLWEKEKLLVSNNFSFSQCFLPVYREFSSISIKFEIVDCNFFVLKSLKFIIWERVNESKKFCFRLTNGSRNRLIGKL